MERVKQKSTKIWRPSIIVTTTILILNLQVADTLSIHTNFQRQHVDMSSRLLPRHSIQPPIHKRPAALNANCNDDSETIRTQSTLQHQDQNSIGLSRRGALEGLAVIAAGTATALIPEVANAGKPELDNTGSLFVPKSEMLSGGSVEARGIGIGKSSRGPKLKPGQALQTVYEPRFIAYLSRFLLKYDPAASGYWAKTYDAAKVEGNFASFAESVEIGLADYFVGPYGSYSSLAAIKAGLSATAPAKSARVEEQAGSNWFLEKILFSSPKKEEKKAIVRDNYSQQGILNLYSLLKARYTTIAEKRQLAILFSFISNPKLQPTTEIKALLSEAEDCCITRIQLNKPPLINSTEVTSRTSSRRGGGYSKTDMPIVRIDPSAALGDTYKPAKATLIMQPTSRVLRISVVDGGGGYSEPPEVVVISPNVVRPCSACAIVDREGHVESVLVLDSGYGYGAGLQEAPKVTIAPPKNKRGDDSQKPVQAKAIAELEYEIVDIKRESGGNGFLASEPPKIFISPPSDDPDWFVETPELTVSENVNGPFYASVTEMKFPDGEIVSLGKLERSTTRVPFKRIIADPQKLLPDSVRPKLNDAGYYYVPEVADYPTISNVPQERYRAVDPVFGNIGSIPVTKGALELSSSEYGRLALSGGVCTVIVRTALNPLELVKTKQQLKNDDELFKFAKELQDEKKPANVQVVTTNPDPKKIGTLDLIIAMVKLRGPLAIFQSSDITFLASVMFGSFGFGATELFRRSFTLNFFTQDGGESMTGVILLLAATLATILTSVIATPFEVLRVRSMGLVESKRIPIVLDEFLAEKKATKARSKGKPQQVLSTHETQGSRRPKDFLPLWAGFAPTASRELAFAIPKFLAFDIFARLICNYVNSQAASGALPVQVGVGTEGLIISALAGSLAGVAGAIVSHPFDLILTYTSAAVKEPVEDPSGNLIESSSADWRAVVKDLLSRDGGPANLFLGIAPRLTFFILVIGLQFFLYDYFKSLLQVGQDDLSLVLDVFYAVRQGLVEMSL